MTTRATNASATTKTTGQFPAPAEESESEVDWWPPQTELEQIDLQAIRDLRESTSALSTGVGRSSARTDSPGPRRDVKHPPPPAHTAPSPPRHSRTAPSSWLMWVAVAGLASIAAFEGLFIWQNRTRPSASTADSAVVQPQPAVAPGSTAGADSTSTERPNSSASASAAKPTEGRLIIRSQPPGAAISIDGRSYGATPVTLEAIAAGDHHIELRLNDAQVRQTVKVEPGATVSIVAPLPSTAPGTGWVTIASPLEMDVFEGDALVGTSRTPRLMLFEGLRTLDLVNEGIGFRERRRVRVEKGKTVSIAVTLPNNSLNINAVPWAEVWVDQKHLGETPLGNISIPIGPHEVVFRHPEFGEKKISTLVKQGAPARVTADMRSK